MLAILLLYFPISWREKIRPYLASSAGLYSKLEMRAPSSDTSYFMTRFTPASPNNALKLMRASAAVSATVTASLPDATLTRRLRSSSLSNSALGYTMFSDSMGCFNKNEPNDVASAVISRRLRSMMWWYTAS